PAPTAVAVPEEASPEPVPEPAPAQAAALEVVDEEPPLADDDYYEVDGDSYDYLMPTAEEAPAEVEPEPLPAARPATGLAAEWLDLFPRLGLAGMTGSIAANCTLVAIDGDTWRLHLD